MIKLENIEKHFFTGQKGNLKKVEVLRDIDLEIEDGEYVSIQGGSGSGKSTMLNIIGLLDVPTGGNYYFCGKKLDGITDYSIYRQKYFGFIFQAYHLINSLSVLENIMLPLIYVNEKPNLQAIKELARQMKIENLLDSKAKNLSGGEKQRVAIARSLVNNPQVIICDEPTGNLDENNTSIVLDVFDDLKKIGKTLVLVTHNQAVADRADVHYVLQDGRLVKL